jgi:hypothetical protein
VVVEVVDDEVLVVESVLGTPDVGGGAEVVVTTGHEVVVGVPEEPEPHATSAIGAISTTARV